MTITSTIKELIWIYKVLTKIDISKVNTKTAYWIGRNARKLEPFVKEFEELQEKIRKDSWFESFRKSAEEEGEEEAKKKYVEQLSEADKEVAEHLETKKVYSHYTIKIGDLDVESENIPALIDLIEEA